MATPAINLCGFNALESCRAARDEYQPHATIGIFDLAVTCVWLTLTAFVMCLWENVPPTKPTAIDVDRITALADLLGAAQLRDLLQMLTVRLDGIALDIRSLPANRATVLADVHQSQGSAGSLGLNSVMELLRDLETYIRSESSTNDVLYDRTMVSIDTLSSSICECNRHFGH